MARRVGKQIRDDSGAVISVRSKNANGEGSVFFRQSRRRWEATYVTLDGQRRTVVGRSKADVVRRRDAKVAELAEVAARFEGGVLGTSPTVADLATWWVDNCTDVRPGTLASYRRQVQLIVERIGDVPLGAFDSGRVRLLLVDLNATMKPDTVRNARTRLRQIAEEGVNLGYLTSNPVERVKAPRPKNDAAPKRTLSIAEVHRLIAACGSHPLGAAVAALFVLGIRSSEALGIAWQDIDLDAATVTIRRGSTYASGVGQRLDDCKTKSTAGTRSLPPSLVELLRQRRKAQAEQRLAAGGLWATTVYRGEALDLVFTGADGKPTYTQALYKAVRECCELAGIDPQGVGAHTGRRTVITTLYAEGEHLEDVAALVGHAQPATTSRYVQHAGDRPERIARRAAELLDPTAAVEHSG